MLRHKTSFSIFLLFWFIMTVFPVCIYAENIITRPESFSLQSFLSKLPEYIISLFQKLKDVKVDVEHITVDRRIPSFENSFFSLPSNLREAWNMISSWFQENIGFGIKNIAHIIANGIIWIFETLLGILRYGLVFLQ